MIDQNRIKCSKCCNSKFEIYEGEMYYCFICQKNFCPICQSKHKEHTNIVNYSIKEFRCQHHQGQVLLHIVRTVKKTYACFVHKNHCLINFINLLEQEGSKKDTEKIEKSKKSVGISLVLLKNSRRI